MPDLIMENLEQEVRELIAEITEIEPEKITMDVDFIEGLGMDSMMALEVLAALEKKYKIRIPEEKLMKLTNLNEAIKLTKEYLNAK